MPTKKTKKVLGIDPGFADTGFGIIELVNNKYKVQDFGSIRTPSKELFSRRLAYIYQQINSLIKQYKPDAVAVEQLFFYRNITTAIKVGHARGVVLLAAERNKAKIYEYTPLQIKQSLTGYGKADKKQMGQMIKTILGLKYIPQPDDASDALATAICCLNSLKINDLDNE